MRNLTSFYIDGHWVKSTGDRIHQVINPSTEAVAGHMSLGEQADVDRAVAAARKALNTFSQTSRSERVDLLERIAKVFQSRAEDLKEAMSEEMGCPRWLADQVQVPLPQGHIETAIQLLKTYEFEEVRGSSMIRKVPIGVCALISPWNYPVSTAITKIIPALATGCTVVLKPSEFSPFSAQILAEVFHEAEVPPGVFNLVFGDGRTAGVALSSHPGVDMVSFTGSTRAGIDVARNAAATVKRVHQELGGKSPNVILPDADFAKAVASGVRFIMLNSGQTCSVPSRMLIPNSRMAEALAIAKGTAEEITVGSPKSGAFVGPVVNETQWKHIQALIQAGIEEGATLLVGGPGKPDGLTKGFYVKPTIFAGVTPEMRIAREEIFGPVLVIQPYHDLEDAVRIANDTPYGLAAYVHAGTIEQARSVGGRIRAGQVYLNGDMDLLDLNAPFGGCKMSGNGREWGESGFEACLEEVAFIGYTPAKTPTPA
ncbi:aldehyde dehydrogenase family protein [Variovorax paradoxus]|nr:aldehyde dehydrogenase family protein [Variovorax paradoxus]MBT2305097.1 aldehyde dehydrogenase family protein [Variovorax paradoxus]